MQSVIFNFYNFGLGGIQRRLADITNFIVQDDLLSDWDVHLVFRDVRKFTFAPRLVKSDRIHIHYRPEKTVMGWHLPFPIYLLWLVMKLRPKVIMGNLEIMSCYAVFVKLVAFFMKIRVVINQGNILSLDIGKKLDTRWVKFCYPRAEKVMVQTQYAKRDLHKNYGVPYDRMQVVHNWTFAKNNHKKVSSYDLIYCGRFSHQKNLLVMMDIVRKVVDQLPKTKVLLLGAGEERGKLVKKIKELSLDDNVEVKHTSHDIYDYLYASKLFILTSLYEGHPMTLLEAMACGAVPVILEYPGVEEYMRHGKTGYIEKDEDGMVRRIVGLLKNSKRLDTVRKAAQEEVDNEYGVENLKQYIKALFPEIYD